MDLYEVSPIVINVLPFTYVTKKLLWLRADLNFLDVTIKYWYSYAVLKLFEY